MKVEKVKTIAAELLNTGKTKIWIDPKSIEEVKEALTREDVKELIKKGIVKKRKENEQSRARARKLLEKKKKGRRKGPGKRKGKRTARAKKKKQHIANVRAQRSLLRKIKKENPKLLEKVGGYRQLYRKIKGGFFRGKRQIEALLKKGE